MTKAAYTIPNFYLLTILLLVTCLLTTCGVRPIKGEAIRVIQLVTIGESHEEVTDVIETRNCCGAAPEKKTVSCSAGTSSQLAVTVGVSGGASAIAELTIEPSVEIALGLNRDSGESLELETPPPNYIHRYRVTKIYTIKSGEVLLKYSSGAEIPGEYRFQASCSLRIESGIETLFCSEICPTTSLDTSLELAQLPTATFLVEPTNTTTFTPEPTATATPLPTLTATLVPLPTSPPPTPTLFNPIDVGAFQVEGYQENGVSFEATVTGRYKFTIIGGAYSPWPTDDYPGNQGWLTTLYIYKNREASWGTRETGLTGPVNPDYSIGSGTILPSKEQAEDLARGKFISIDLSAGNYLLFVPIDEKTAYNFPSNNRGEVLLSVFIIAPQ